MDGVVGHTAILQHSAVVAGETWQSAEKREVLPCNLYGRCAAQEVLHQVGPIRASRAWRQSTILHCICQGSREGRPRKFSNYWNAVSHPCGCFLSAPYHHRHIQSQSQSPSQSRTRIYRIVAHVPHRICHYLACDHLSGIVR